MNQQLNQFFLIKMSTIRTQKKRNDMYKSLQDVEQ